MEKTFQADYTDRPYEQCAVFGVYNSSADAAETVFYGLQALQHRGQETAGIVGSDGQRLNRCSGYGLIREAMQGAELAELHGNIAIGHTSYESIASLAYMQPAVSDKGEFALAYNGSLNVDTVSKNLLKPTYAATASSAQLMAGVIEYYMDHGLHADQAIMKSYASFDGAFSCVAMTTTSLLAFRDRHGVRPLSIGKLETGYVIASETCALDAVGAVFLRDVCPGELVVIDGYGLHSYQIRQSQLQFDIFEFVYFARPDSLLLGQRVQLVRENLGSELACESSIDADVVVPVPDSAIPAAYGFADRSGLPLAMALYKNRYIHRTSIQPSAALRERELHMKLAIIHEYVKDKRVVLIDDSIVTGTTLRKIVAMVRAAGAREVHVRISSPPIVCYDPYSINQQDETKLIAAHKTIGQVGESLGADSLGYLSYGGMIRATGLPESTFRTVCFTKKQAHHTAEAAILPRH